MREAEGDGAAEGAGGAAHLLGGRPPYGPSSVGHPMAPPHGQHRAGRSSGTWHGPPDLHGVACLDAPHDTSLDMTSRDMTSRSPAVSISRDAIAGFNRAQWQQQLGPLLRLWDQLMESASGIRAAIKDVAAARSPAGAKAGTRPIEDLVFMERGNGLWLVSPSTAALRRWRACSRGRTRSAPRCRAAWARRCWPTRCVVRGRGGRFWPTRWGSLFRDFSSPP